MTSDPSLYTQPYYQTTEFSCLEMGHATNSMFGNETSSSAYLIFSTLAAPRGKNAAHQDAWFSIIADGIGDSDTCNVASQISAESCYYYLSNTPSSFAEMQRQLNFAFQHANKELLDCSQQDNHKCSYQSSILAATVLDGSFFLSSVGNSQAYLFRNDSVHCLTYESVRQRALQSRNKLFPPKRAVKRTELTNPQFLGETSRLPVRHASFTVKGEPESEQTSSARRLANHLTLEPEDVIVLCSNEISNQLGKSKIETIATLLPPQEAAEEIIQLATEVQPAVACSTIVLRWNGDRQPAETYSEQRHYLR